MSGYNAMNGDSAKSQGSCVPIQLKRRNARQAPDKPQTLTVEMFGNVIDTRVLTDKDWHALNYSMPPSKNTPGGEWLVLRTDPAWKVRGDRRTFGIMTRDLKWIN